MLYFVGVLFLLGGTSGLRPDSKYTFFYEGTLATGVPSINHQYAGTGLRALVHIDVMDSNKAVVTMDNITSAEFNDEIGDIRHERKFPIVYTQNYKLKPLEKPFILHLDENTGKVMEVPKDEILWVTNIRKSLYQFFKVHNILYQLNITNDSKPPTRTPYIKRMEDTLHGTCQTQYTLTPAYEKCTRPGSEVGFEEFEENEENGDNTGYRKNAEKGVSHCKLYRLVRSIDFNNCTDIVFLQLNGIRKRSNRDNITDILTRSSVTEYLIRKVTNNNGTDEDTWMDIQGVRGSGEVMVESYGVKSKELHLITSQKLRLKSFKESNSEPSDLPENTKPIRTWNFEVLSPWSGSSTRWKWVNYESSKPLNTTLFPETMLTGIKIENKDVKQNIKYECGSLLEKVVHALLNPEVHTQRPGSPFGSLNGIAAADLRTTATIFHLLNPDDFDMLIRGQKTWFVDETDDGQNGNNNGRRDSYNRRNRFDGPRRNYNRHTDNYNEWYRNYNRRNGDYHTQKDNLNRQTGNYNGQKGQNGQNKNVSMDHNIRLAMHLLVDIMGDCGSYGCVKKLLDAARHKHINASRIATVFMTYPTVIFEPAAIPEIIDYAIKLNLYHHPYLTSAVYINTATIIRTQCISDPKDSNIPLPFPLYGHYVCKKSDTEIFFKHITNLLEMAEDNWECLVLHRALMNLGNDEALEFLLKVLKDRTKSVLIRTSIVHGLTPDKFGWRNKEKILNILTTLRLNAAEPQEIRELGVLISVKWRPNEAWWQTLALSTWSELNPSVAIFTSSVIKAASYVQTDVPTETNHLAESVLPLAMPVESSFHSSYNINFNTFMNEKQFATSVDFAWLVKYKDIFPRDVFTTIKGSFSSFNLNLFEGRVSMADFTDYYRQLRALRQRNVTSPAQQISTMIQDQLMGGIKEIKSPLGLAYMNILENIEYYLPINNKVIQDFMQELDGLAVESEVLKYVNPFKQEMFFVSDVGLPIISMYYNPTVLYGKYTKKGTWQPKFKDFNMKLNLKFTSKTTTVLKALVPYGKGVVATGGDIERSLSIPFTVHWAYETEKDIETNFIVDFDKSGNPIPLLYYHSIPFTLIKNLIPDHSPEKIHDVKSIFNVPHKKKPFYHTTDKILKDYGLELYLTWESDLDYAYTRANFLKTLLSCADIQMILLSSPIMDYTRTYLLFHPEQSRTKEFHIHYKSLAHWKPVNETDPSRISFDPYIFPPGTPHYRNESIHRNCNWGNKPLFMEKKLGIKFDQIYNFDISGTVLCDDPLTTQKQYHGKITINTDKQAVTIRVNGIVPTYGMEHLLPLDLTTTLDTHVQFNTNQDLKAYIPIRTETLFDLSSHRRQYLLMGSPSVDSIYDEAYTTIESDEEYLRTSQPGFYNFTRDVDDFIMGVLHQYVNYKWTPYNPAIFNKISIKGTRSMLDEKWRLEKKTSSYEADLDSIETSPVVDKGMQLKHLVQSPSVASDKFLCIATGTAVLTFNDEKYSFDCTADCWITLISNCGYDSPYYVLVKQSILDPGKIGELKYEDSKHNIVIELFNGKPPRINGEKIMDEKRYVNDKGGNTIAIIEYKDKISRLVIPHHFIIKLDDILYIKRNPYCIDEFCGLCGGNKIIREKHNHGNYKLGPDNCLYKDPNLFVTSWTLNDGLGCNRNILNHWKKKQLNYQKTCPKMIPGLILNRNPISYRPSLAKVYVRN